MHRFLNNNKKSFAIAYARFVTELHHFRIMSLNISWDFTFHFRLNVSVNITSISKPFLLNFVPEERQENPSFCSCIFILITCLILRVLDKNAAFSSVFMYISQKGRVSWLKHKTFEEGVCCVQNVIVIAFFLTSIANKSFKSWRQ